jgi:hypothetical protein
MGCESGKTLSTSSSAEMDCLPASSGGRAGPRVPPKVFRKIQTGLAEIVRFVSWGSKPCVRSVSAPAAPTSACRSSIAPSREACTRIVSWRSSTKAASPFRVGLGSRSPLGSLSQGQHGMAIHMLPSGGKSSPMVYRHIQMHWD